VPVVTGELSWEKLCEAGWFHEGFEKRG